MRSISHFVEKHGWKKIVILSLVVVVTLVIVALLLKEAIPLLVEAIKNTNNEAATIADVQKFGWRGVVLLALSQMMLTMSALLPDAPIQMLAGLVYGKWGVLITLAGMVMANAVLFLAVRYIGNSFHSLLPEKHKKPSHSFLSLERINEMKHPELIVFFINLLPGLPNGFLPFIFARTNMSAWKFLLFVALGELPSLAITVGFGSSLSSGNKTLIIAIGAVLVAMFAAGFFLKNRIMKHIEHIAS